MNDIVVSDIAAVAAFFVKWFKGKPLESNPKIIDLHPSSVSFGQGEPPPEQTVSVMIGCIGAEGRLQDMVEQENSLVYKDTEKSGHIAQKVIFETAFGFELHVTVVFA